MAAVSEASQALSDKYFSYWESTQQPLEAAQSKAALGLVDSQAELDAANIAAQKELLPSTTALTLAKNSSTTSLLPSATATTQSYLDAANTGVNANEWATSAGNDAKIQAANTQKTLARNASRLGLDPSSGAYARAAQDAGTTSALGTAAAMTTGRTAALKENWNRLSGGASAAAAVLK